MMGLKACVRQGLLAVGRRAPDWLLRKLGNIVSELELDSWLKARGLVVRGFVRRREALFELVASEVGQLRCSTWSLAWPAVKQRASGPGF
jgi:hypothetical protein